MAELDEDPLALGADQVDLGDPRHAQQLLADVLAEVLQPAERQPVRGEHVEHRVDVAVLIVDLWPEHPRRQVGRMSSSFLRVWYHRSGTRSGGVSSRKVTVVAMTPGRV